MNRNEIIKAIKDGVFDDRFSELERVVKERRRQIEINVQAEAFRERLQNWSEAKNRPHRRAPTFAGK